MNLSFPKRLSLAQLPTPLTLLSRLSSAVDGPRIWIKRDDMSGSAISGNKVRKLEFVLAKAIAQGADTILTCGGVQSNHCRTTALLCAQLGLHCHLLLRGQAQTPPTGNLLLDQLTGATISYYSVAEYVARGDQLFDDWVAHYKAQGRQPFCIPVGASDGDGLWGYLAAAQELADDCQRLGIAPKHIVCATGSGGTQAGLTVGSKLCGLGARVWGINVCDDEQYFLAKVASDIRQWAQRYGVDATPADFEISVIDGYVGAGYAKAGPEIFALIRQLAACEGVVLDPVYTGKAFYGMLQEIRQGRFSDSEDIVFIHTGGIFGLFAQSEQLFADPDH